MAGEWGIVEIEKLRPLNRKEMKFQHESSKYQHFLSTTYPFWIGDIVLYAMKQKALIRDIRLFKAVVNGRVILLHSDKQRKIDAAKFSPDSH